MSAFSFFSSLKIVFIDTSQALLPLLALFAIFQVFFLKLSKARVINLFKGMILAYLGLSLFLLGVYEGFLPVGETMGQALASLSYNWILIPIGFVLGFTVIFAEPAVRVLNYEVEKVSAGYISQNIMLFTLSVGGGLAIMLAMSRILYGISLWYFIIPGYALALLLIPFSKDIFVAVAFDAGGTATGPMTGTFILAMAIGVATVIDERSPILEGFGLVALVALTPILSVLIIGLFFKRKEKEIERKRIRAALQVDSGYRQEGNG